MCKKHEEQNDFLRKIIRKEEIVDSEGDEKVLSSKIKSKDETPGDGPLKPWPRGGAMKEEDLDRIELPWNLDLDNNQKKTLLRQQPLLIDGLAGTGKTSVLAYRSAMRTALSSDKTNILVCASKSHVVKRMLENHIEYSDNGVWDEKDPFQIEYIISPDVMSENNDKILKTSDLEHFKSTLPLEGFDEIIIDECQDLTYLEFQMLVRLCIRHDVRRITIAGDPLQTLNPTGFDWSRIKAMFVNLSSLKAKDITIQSFHKNYRSQGSIVEFANAIQRHRSHVTKNSDIIKMIPAKESGDRAALILYNPLEPSHVEATHKILMNSERSATSVVVWAKDDAEILQMLKGESDNDDPILTSLWDEQSDDGDSLSFREEKILIHSSSSIKGGEVEAVALYRFGSSPDAKKYLNSLTMEAGEIKSATIQELIPIKYAYSRLYVGLTRAFQKVFLIEDKDGMKFWQSLKLTRLDSNNEAFTEKSDFFINFNDYEDVVAASNAVELTSSRETTLDNFYKRFNDFLKTRDRISLDIAIALGDELVSQGEEIKRDLAELKAERALIRKENTEDEKQKMRYLREAQEYFLEAKKLDRVIPIYFDMGEFQKCIEALKGFADNDFLNFVKLSCELHLRKSEKEILEESKSAKIEQLLRIRISVPDIWKRLIEVAVVKESFKKYLKKLLSVSELVDLEFEYGSFVYSLDELLNSEFSREEKLHILTTRKVGDKYASNIKPDLYKNLVNKVYSEQKTLPAKSRILHDFVSYKFSSSHREMFLKEYLDYHELMLKSIKKIKNPSTGKNLFIAIEEYMETNRKSGDDLFILDEKNTQISALMLAVHMRDLNFGLDSGYVPKGISNLLNSLTKPGRDWSTYSFKKLFNYSHALELLVKTSERDILNIKDIENLGVMSYSWYDVETHFRVLSGLWDQINRELKELDYQELFSPAYLGRTLDNFITDFTSMFNVVYEFVTQLRGKMTLQDRISTELFSSIYRFMEGKFDKSTKRDFFQKFVKDYIIKNKLEILPQFKEFFKRYVISMNLKETELKSFARVKDSELQDIVNALKRVESKNDLLKNPRQSKKKKDSLQSLIDELSDLDVEGIEGLQGLIDEIKSKMPLSELEIFEALDKSESFKEFSDKLVIFSNSHPKIIEKLISENLLCISTIGVEFSLNNSSMSVEDFEFLIEQSCGMMSSSPVFEILRDLMFKENDENCKLGFTSMLFLPNIGSLWYLNALGRVELDDESLKLISYALTSNIIGSLSMTNKIKYDNVEGRERILQIIKNQEFEGEDVELEKSIINLSPIPRHLLE